jgi:hypothetical protein
VQTEKPITSPSDPNWMMLLIRTGQAGNHVWNGYDFIVNRIPPTKYGAVLEKNNGGWNWLLAADVKFRVEGNEMHLAVPRSALFPIPENRNERLTRDPVTFDFKWVDNVKLPDDLTVLYVDGDTAPLGRFRFRYISE